MGKQKNPIPSIYKAKKKKKNLQKLELREKYCRKKEKLSRNTNRFDREGGLKQDHDQKKNTGTLIVKYEIVLQ